jgi:hypothetical protein
MGEPPRAASNMTPKVEKLAKEDDAKVVFIAWRSAEVPAALNGASGPPSPLQPDRLSETNATVTTDRFANCSTRMGSASIRSKQFEATNAFGGYPWAAPAERRPGNGAR